MSKNKEQLLCTESECIDDRDEHMLSCINCERRVHYRCTKLPAYHIHATLNKRGAKFFCQNCVQPPEELMELVPERKRSIPYVAVKEIERLKREVAGCENIISSHKENEKALQQIIDEQKVMITELKRKLNTNPSYHTLEYVEQKFESKIECLKDSILQTIKQQSEDIQKSFEVRSETYATVAMSRQNNNTAHESPTSAATFKEVLKLARKEEVAEEKNKTYRSKNIIIHGITETNNNTDDRDKTFASTLIKDTHTNASIKQVIRIGVPNVGKNRPLKVILTNEEEKVKLMGNLPSLRGIETYKGISITEDLTQEERKTLKELATTAKNKNKDLTDNTYIWRVRGTSKNGFYLKKVQTEKIPSPQNH